MIRSFTKKKGLPQGLENKQTGNREKESTRNKFMDIWSRIGIPFKTRDIVRKVYFSPVLLFLLWEKNWMANFLNSQPFYSLCFRGHCKSCSLASRCHLFISYFAQVAQASGPLWNWTSILICNIFPNHLSTYLPTYIFPTSFHPAIWKLGLWIESVFNSP